MTADLVARLRASAKQYAQYIDKQTQASLLREAADDLEAAEARAERAERVLRELWEEVTDSGRRTDKLVTISQPTTVAVVHVLGEYFKPQNPEKHDE